MYAIRKKAIKEWDLLSRAENNAEMFFKGFFKTNFNIDSEIIFTNDDRQLSMPDEDNAPVIGASVIHTK